MNLVSSIYDIIKKHLQVLMYNMYKRDFDMYTYHD